MVPYHCTVRWLRFLVWTNHTIRFKADILGHTFSTQIDYGAIVCICCCSGDMWLSFWWSGSKFFCMCEVALTVTVLDGVETDVRNWKVLLCGVYVYYHFWLYIRQQSVPFVLNASRKMNCRCWWSYNRHHHRIDHHHSHHHQKHAALRHMWFSAHMKSPQVRHGHFTTVCALHCADIPFRGR